MTETPAQAAALLRLRTAQETLEALNNPPPGVDPEQLRVQRLQAQRELDDARANARAAGVPQQTPQTPPAQPGAPTGASPPATPPAPAPTLRDIEFNFEPNTLNQYDSYAYHFRLSIINDLDANDPQLRKKLISNEIRKIVVAESGVTAGFNIVDCEIEDNISANFRSRGTMTTSINLTVVEPYSLTLTDRLFNGSRALQVRNWRLAPMVLELEFRYIREDGTYFTPTGDQKLVKVYQLLILDFDAKLTEVGTTYEIKASVQGNLGFNDFYYILPQSHRLNTVPGNATPSPGTPATPNPGGPAAPAALPIVAQSADGTVGSLFTSLGELLTKFYTDARTSNIDNPVLPVMVYKFVVAPELARQQINFSPTANSRRLAFNSVGNNAGEITVSRGIGIGDFVDDVLASLKDPTFFIPNQNTTGEVLIPRIECITENIGWDGILNDYIRRFTFVISMKSSNRPVPYARFGEEFQGNVARMRTRLQNLATKSIRKIYDYYYTGLNTEVLGADIKFNLLHIVPQALLQTLALPEFADSVVNRTITQQAEFTQLNQELRQLRSRLGILQAPNGPPPGTRPLEAADIQREITRLQTRLGEIRSNSVFPFDPGIAPQLGLPANVVADQQALRNELAEIRAANQRAAEQRSFAEDLPRAPLSEDQLQSDPLRLRYGADPRDIANFFSRPTPAGAPSVGGTAEDAVRPLVTSILSQIYDRSNQQLLEIDMDIRGDPYWLGVTDLERQEELLKFLETPAEGQFWGAPVSNGQALGNGPRLNMVNVHDQDANIMLKFRAGAAPSEQDGFQQLNSESDMFYGVYTVINVTHEFKQGKFTQKLKAMRDTLVNIQALRNAAQGAPATESNPTQPPQVPPINAPTGPRIIENNQPAAQPLTPAQARLGRLGPQRPNFLPPFGE